MDPYVEPLDNVGGENESNQSQKTQRTHKAKARLVVLGYLDPLIEDIPRDSPTLKQYITYAGPAGKNPLILGP